MVYGGVCKTISVITRINYDMLLCMPILCQTLFKQHQRFVRKPSKFDLGSPVKPVFSLYLDTRSRFSSFFYQSQSQTPVPFVFGGWCSIWKCPHADTPRNVCYAQESCLHKVSLLQFTLYSPPVLV